MDKGEKCKRKLIQIDGENFYLIVGGDFAQVTVPRENDPTMSKTRRIAETICEGVTCLLQDQQ